MAEAGQCHLGGANGAAGFRLSFQDEDLAPRPREDDTRGEAVETGSNNDDVVLQGEIRDG